MPEARWRRIRTGDERVCGDAFRGGGGGDRVELAEWFKNGKPSALGAISGRGGGAGGDYTGSGICGPMPALAIGLSRVRSATAW